MPSVYALFLIQNKSQISHKTTDKFLVSVPTGLYYGLVPTHLLISNIH